MAQITGFLPKNRRFGGYLIYRRNGKNFLREYNPGITKKRLMTDPNMVRLRENMNMFTCLSRATTAFAYAIAPQLKFSDGTIRNRIMKLLANIRKASSSRRDKPSVLISQCKHLLTGFELNNNMPKESVWKLYTESTMSADRKSSVLYAMLSPMVKESFPQATHFRLVRFLGVVSDTIFDEITGKFVPASPAVNGIHATTETDFIPVDASAPEVTLRTRLPVATLPPAAVALELLGIEFFKEEGGRYKPVNGARAMEIVDAF